MPASYTLGFIAPARNPLTGAFLEPGQRLVYGPQATGPRVTVVSSSNPASWPHWITADAAGQPVDAGTIAGGTWDGTGAQGLPDLVSTGIRVVQTMPWWGWLLALGVTYALVFGKGKGRHNW